MQEGKDFKGLMSPETEKTLGAKLKFKNAIAEAVDDPFISIVDNNIFEPLSKKLPSNILPFVVEALAAVIDEMPEIEI